jgi:hypothetical protein
MDEQVFLSSTSRMDAQGVSPPPAEDVQGCLSTTSSMDMQGCLSTTSMQGTCRVSLHHQQYGRAGLSFHHQQGTCRVVSPPPAGDVQGVSPPPAVWKCRVSLHHQQYGNAGCLSTTSSVEVQGVSPPPVVWKCRVSLYHRQYGRAGCLSTTSSMDVQGVSPPLAVWTWWLKGVSPPQQYICTCRLQGVFQTLAVWTRGFLSTTSSLNMQGVYAFLPASGQSCTGTIKNADVETSPVLESGDPFRYRNSPVPD